MLPSANQTPLLPKPPGALIHTAAEGRVGVFLKCPSSERLCLHSDSSFTWCFFDLKSPSLPRHLRCLLMVALKGWYFTEKCRFNPIRLCLTSEPATISSARNSRYLKAIQTILLRHLLHSPSPPTPLSHNMDAVSGCQEYVVPCVKCFADWFHLVPAVFASDGLMVMSLDFFFNHLLGRWVWFTCWQNFSALR